MMFYLQGKQKLHLLLVNYFILPPPLYKKSQSSTHTFVNTSCLLQITMSGSGIQPPLTTHVLDTARGKPANSVPMVLSSREQNGEWKQLYTGFVFFTRIMHLFLYSVTHFIVHIRIILLKKSYFNQDYTYASKRGMCTFENLS